jgi:hypothetical protein
MNKAKLSQVFMFIKDMAIALRMNSSYSRREKPHAERDVMWLSDALHNYHLIAKALIDDKNKAGLIDDLIMTYADYTANAEAMATFKRWDIDINAAIKILESLKDCVFRRR